jgi:hypothetical protein
MMSNDVAGTRLRSYGDDDDDRNDSSDCARRCCGVSLRSHVQEARCVAEHSTVTFDPHLRVSPPHLARGALIAWASMCLVVGGALLVFHLLPLPVPPIDDPALQRALVGTSTPEERGRWRLVHVMYARCPCSNKIIEHLVSSTRPRDVRERVVIVDASDVLRDRLRTAGFIVEVVDANTLQQRYHLEAAPVLIVADDTDRIRYVGGYTERKQGPVSHDVEMVERLRRGDRLEGLPLFGCATSRALQQAVDPFSLRTLFTLGGPL